MVISEQELALVTLYIIQLRLSNITEADNPSISGDHLSQDWLHVHLYILRREP